MEEKQVHKEMSKGKENKWQLIVLDAISATNIVTGSNTFSITDTDNLRREANSEAIIQAVNSTWLKGLDPNKMESIYKKALQLVKALEHVHLTDKAYKSLCDFDNELDQIKL